MAIKVQSDKKYLYQFIPDKFKYLMNVDKILYKGVNLKTDYLINIIHELVLKYYFNKEEIIDREIKFNMWSMLLRKKYGTFYNFYISYLVENGFMIQVSDYYRNKKSRTYKLNIEGITNISRCKIFDTILLKKNTKEYLSNTFLYYNNSPIDVKIREKLVEDLYKIRVDVKSSREYLDCLKENRLISHVKYMNNCMSVDNIGIGNIFFKFDEYGRMHTNFTVLKKHIRQNFLTIDGLSTDEVDLHNSQPLFLTQILKKEMDKSILYSKEVNTYIDLVNNGLIYEEMMKSPYIETREDAKLVMYKVLFGHNGDAKQENKIFFDMFPTVYSFIKEYKHRKDDYKTISHQLQSLESNFIFGKVVKHLMEVLPDMPLFTIHDSISYPLKYKDDVRNIFDYHRRNIITS